MALFKCKMCGGSLEINEGMTVCECEYCGTQQTLPKAKDDIQANLFNRANNLRMKSEFDKAQEIYEKIVNTNEDEAEAYWGIVLCKYGIEYVEDPVTLNRIPTCHRTQLESVVTDVDYKSAIEHADLYQKAVYEREAATIDALQKNILSIVHKEKPYDVFICYKETDDNGKRTVDSVIANDIYHQLTQEGYKVFYAAITLEDKIGQEYEPYIFAALNSSKVMLVVGTKPEYFNAVWVKNEWSRYLKIIKNDHKKMLIPCYKDMDAYDLPDEFSHLQAQDMSKIGFINDVVRGIKKVITKDEPKKVEVVQSTVVKQTSGNIENLIKRGNLSLEDKKWDEAVEFFDRVLDEDVEEYRAYVGKLCAEYKVSSEADLLTIGINFTTSDNYKKACRFGGEQVQNKLFEINQQGIYNRAEREFNKARTNTDFDNAQKVFKSLLGFKDSKVMVEKCHTASLQYLYNKAEQAYNQAKTNTDYDNAEKQFLSISDFKDSKEMAEKCHTASLQYLYNKAEQAYNQAKTNTDYDNAEKQFLSISDFNISKEMAKKCHMASLQYLYDSYIKDMNKVVSEEKFKLIATKFANLGDFSDAMTKSNECLEKAEICHKDDIYASAKSSMTGEKITKYETAIKTFQTIEGWKDTNEQINICQKKIEEIKAKEEADRIAEVKAAKKQKKIIVITTSIVCACIAFVIVLTTVIIPNSKYNAAIKLMDDEKYEEAISAFEALNGYKDSTDKISLCQTALKDIDYNAAVSLLNDGKIIDAYENLVALNGYKDSATKASEIFGQYQIEKLKIAEVGDTVIFGAYEQDNNTSNGKEDVEWIVLAKENVKALVISKYALDCQQYNTSHTYVTWESCSLRKWMNGTFLNNAFSAEEQAQIQNTNVSADKNPDYSTNPGNATTDKVFLLSITETEKYFTTEEARKCAPTAYAKAQGAYTSDDYKTASGEDTCWWWLRSPGGNQGQAAVVDYGGWFGCLGNYVNDDDHCVRPALWISIE